jgi:RimJ/RimL family protein N-acetyltransferase
MFDLRSAPTLATARLRLRLPDAGDLEPLAALNADPAVARYLGNGAPLDRLGSWRQLAAFIGHWAMLGHGFFAVERRSDGAFLGRVGLLEPATWPGLEIAWAIAPAHWGEGYATEAAAAVRDWAFSTLGKPRLISLIDPGNRASIRVAEKIGEREAGTAEILGRSVRLFAIDNPAAAAHPKVNQ